MNPTILQDWRNVKMRGSKDNANRRNFSEAANHRENTPIGAGYDPTKPMVSWRSGWRTLTKRAGLAGLRFHDLRHHSITKLAEAGVPEQTLMSIAGHVSKEMLEHYSHIRMEAKRSAVEALDRVKPPFVEASSAEEEEPAPAN